MDNCTEASTLSSRPLGWCVTDRSIGCGNVASNVDERIQSGVGRESGQNDRITVRPFDIGWEDVFSHAPLLGIGRVPDSLEVVNNKQGPVMRAEMLEKRSERVTRCRQTERCEHAGQEVVNASRGLCRDEEATITESRSNFDTLYDGVGEGGLSQASRTHDCESNRTRAINNKIDKTAQFLVAPVQNLWTRW
ncbi:hypothetical protein EXIGLDRAFT_746529 [Exidia glandulosa HHB12029]|uniref:Uncharacterized protein n=1 Tax=Exidia glandulosa HHB12029 TaxID=1314781 RepID=A0A165M249_EXIGL|nr:hypothetical protein EXIGLDRAFT_746529 [Exidia glandulosa HHB12029]